MASRVPPQSGAAGQAPAEPLRLHKVIVHHVRLKMRTPFVAAWGRQEERDVILVEAVAAGGESPELAGWGEAPVLAQPVYNEETAATAWHMLNDFFIPQVLSGSIPHPRAAAERLAVFHGHAMARAALEGAIWDLWARRSGVSLRQLLGGRQERVAAGAVVGVQDNVAATLRRVAHHVSRGYRRIKLKVYPGHDAAVVKAVRDEFGAIALAVDANGAYRLDDLPALQALDEFRLQMIEQPLPWDDLLGHARVQAQLATPICLDETVQTVAHARQAIALGAGRIVNVKAGRLGGLSSALAVHDVCHAHGLPVWSGGLLETGVGRAHNIALASLPGFTLPGDLAPPGEYLEEDIVDPPIVLEPDGYLRVPDGPGIGVRVRRERLAAFTVRRCSHPA